VSEVAVLAARDECHDFLAAKFMPLQAQPRFRLPDDLGLYQGRGVGAIQGNDQLDTRQGRGLQRCLDKGSTQAHVGHAAQRDNTCSCPQLDARIDAFALSPTMFHEQENASPVPTGPGLAVSNSASKM
jgi:hypothetical protein